MATEVKETARSRRHAGRSRVSGKHQVTIPIAAFKEAGLHEGDLVRIEAQGPGRVVIARVEDLIDEYAGCISTRGQLGETVRSLRLEWD
jgi:bifunctional DNA-binding transcriptional regulator/antitoxin component of YhaV-PrlF toxin-antitoxin module